MNAAIVENNMITNVVVLPEGADPAAFGAYPLPDGKWIGDPYDDTPDRIAALESENRLLREQVTALGDQNDFQEELIVELANIVYA
ncbi:hypothetical protein [uncultured Dysosmobacter sp.]|uniref:hypothetical protein n=1 Tax=uncultured Dysosmobacter sp. TaxID=2591384 RepID=UPI0026355BA2|nr:hypothetical protein [uncultured Dysosmobacter sp.]